ncbi:hypothetical protein TBLA_0D03140 [Henningerozyma blattae CBS 6284]|uniref:Agglutinin-like protein N-terminal domain-containing protein n=1 Tax=Henningerozyma blattae (strain ATCC 34711 / CBS 6284 / DSM 70876 / NBRC 10599 / NRRL Y-10934 / UCD 77-7) TaxID=1071380 RepID=I2H362_HENB6|nr:hypothetical protein TBLA_0D03140 [Tetrapisispora blattae CBS 6284]CCH60814.1 hypothetical protein TBLA_0D03140 [Tetrapisispora blattae CBS 6284]
MLTKIITLFIWCYTISVTSASDITQKLSFSNLAIVPETASKLPQEGWQTSFDFSVSDPSALSKGDIFTIDLPHVYRIKFENDADYLTVFLKDGTAAFKCHASQQAAYKFKDTILSCTVASDLSSYSSVSGSIEFSISFSNGDSLYQYEFENAKYFKSGKMNFQFDDLSADVTFDATELTDLLYAVGRSTSYDSVESYYLAMQCKNGAISEGSIVINYDINGEDFQLDCQSAQARLAKDFNDWWFPTSEGESNAIDVVCYGSNLMINVANADPEHMLWINALQSVKKGVNTIDHDITMDYTCVDTVASSTYSIETSTTKRFVIYQGINFATGSGSTLDFSSATPTVDITSTTTTGWTGHYTSTYSTGVTTFTGSDGIPTTATTYFVETPNVNTVTTTTTGWTGHYTSTYSTGVTTFTGSDGIPTTATTYFVETPNVNTVTTTTTGWTGHYTSTYSTGVTTFTGSDGIPTTATTYFVETPGLANSISNTLSSNSSKSISIPSSSLPESKYTTIITTFNNVTSTIITCIESSSSKGTVSFSKSSLSSRSMFTTSISSIPEANILTTTSSITTASETNLYRPPATTISPVVSTVSTFSSSDKPSSSSSQTIDIIVSKTTFVTNSRISTKTTYIESYQSSSSDIEITTQQTETMRITSTVSSLSKSKIPSLLLNVNNMIPITSSSIVTVSTIPLQEYQGLGCHISIKNNILALVFTFISFISF